MEFYSGRRGQDHSWKTAWKMPRYIRPKIDAVFREQLESAMAGAMGTDCITGYGHSELPGRVKPDQILAFSNTPSREETFPKRPSCLFPRTSFYTKTKRRVSQGPGCSPVWG